MAALEHRLEVKMMQKLILTPQLQQAIRLLQLPQLELSQTLNNELVENPFLEEGGLDEAEPLDERTGQPESESFPAQDLAETPLDRMVGFGVDEYFDARSYDGRDLGYFTPDVHATNLTPEQYADQSVSLTGAESLNEHLTWQLRLKHGVGPEVGQVAELVIGNLDERGYLPMTDAELAEAAEADEAVVREAVALVQSFDPTGVAARDLIECLALQLQALDLGGSLAEKIVRESLPDVERRRYPQIAAQFGVTVEDVKVALKVIEGLNPRPGRLFNESDTIYIKPDVFVTRDGDEFRIVLNEEGLPPIRINSYYRRILAQRNSLDKEEREYLNERLKSAQWLLKSLDHRNRTLYRVTESIVRHQREFFEKNVSALKPLNLRDVADDVEMHESTISRATSNKYLSCAHGLYSFRYFFSSGLQSVNGAVSSESVKDTIKRIVSEENAAKPLSDQKISNMISRSGVQVARRTVAKYREELNIPPVSMRRQTD
jgi:RNA polymerase sigma-54 factor